MPQTERTISARPGTDFWRKPPHTDVSTAPNYVFVVPSTTFHRARVTVSAPWTRLYDQGGLFFFFPTSVSEGKQCWLKAGVEHVEGRPHVSVVAAREWADWSLGDVVEGGELTLEIEREAVDEAAGKGSSLFVYIVRGGVRSEVPIREVTWAFEQEGQMSVGVFAARPTALGEEDKEELKVALDLNWE
jgi:uncharacterized protein